MSVGEFTCFSDHKPLRLTLDLDTKNAAVSKPLHKAYEKAPSKYKITPDGLKNLASAMKSSRHQQNATNILNSNFHRCDTEASMYELNNEVTKHLQMIADSCFSKTKGPRTTKPSSINKQPWFTNSIREAKRSLSKATEIVSHLPSNDYLRKNFYLVKKSYKKLISKAKNDYFNTLNLKIESGTVLDWKQFRKIRNTKTVQNKFDALDMQNFRNFFSGLYSNVHTTLSPDQKSKFLEQADIINMQSQFLSRSTTLNKRIETAEILNVLATLKNGKSSSDDMICNEILKALSGEHLELLCLAFNQCLNTKTYPWNNNIITPLHKKGAKSNPDNYRAVAVSSTIGKLFSTIMLNRIIEFKQSNEPDPINQLGFSKGAQTYDHIITLNTITSKYKKSKKPVYAVFVDFRKAFDSVCREALFLKLAKLGITGKVFDVLKHMYDLI